MPRRPLKLRRADSCVRCSTPLAAGTDAVWDSAPRTVMCLACADPTPPLTSTSQPINTGEAGASAAREHERRKQNREEGVRAKHPRTAALRLALRGAPQHEVAFRHGQVGEESVGTFLDERTAHGPGIVLHDRRMPRGRGNVDHIAIAPTGVYVIDAKAWQGKVTAPTPLFGRQKLLIDGRDRTSLIDGLDRQVAVVRATLGEDHGDVAVRGVLCFTRAELPLLRTLTIRSHLLLYRKALGKRINEDGSVCANVIEHIARKLEPSFLPPEQPPTSSETSEQADALAPVVRVYAVYAKEAERGEAQPTAKPRRGACATGAGRSRPDGARPNL